MFTCEICHPGIGNKQASNVIGVGDYAMNLCVSHQREFANDVHATPLFQDFVKAERRANVLQALTMADARNGEVYTKQLELRENLYNQLYDWSKNWLKSQIEAVVK